MITDMRFHLLPFVLLLTLTACAELPESAYVSGAGRLDGTGQALGQNAVGEECTQQVNGSNEARHANIYCGNWQQPSGNVRVAGPVAPDSLLNLARGSAWRQTLEQRFACGEPRLTTIMGGVPAALMSCTRRQGGWPHVAFVAAAGGGASGQDGWFADGVLPALPAIERSVALLSGRAEASTATSSSDADALLAGRLAAEAFSSGDINKYDQVMAAGGAANRAERFADAEQAFRAALALQEKALGAGNPNTATTLERLALQISNQGRYAEADGLFARAATLAARSDDPLAPPRLQHYTALAESEQNQSVSGATRQGAAGLRSAPAAFGAECPHIARHHRAGGPVEHQRARLWGCNGRWQSPLRPNHPGGTCRIHRGPPLSQRDPAATGAGA